MSLSLEKKVIVCLQGYLKNIFVSKKKVLICLQGNFKNVIIYGKKNLYLSTRTYRKHS